MKKIDKTKYKVVGKVSYEGPIYVRPCGRGVMFRDLGDDENADDLILKALKGHYDKVMYSAGGDARVKITVEVLKSRAAKPKLCQHEWELPFQYVYGPIPMDTEPVTEGKPYEFHPSVPRRKEPIKADDGQMRCGKCLAWKHPNEPT